jgi:hypothetical protein
MMAQIAAPNMYPQARILIQALPDDVLDTLSHDQLDQLADVFANRLAAEWLDGCGVGAAFLRQKAPPTLRGRIGFECDYSQPIDRAPKPFTAARPLSAELQAGLAKARIQGATFGFGNTLESSSPPLRDNMLLMLACALIGVTVALVLAAIP